MQDPQELVDVVEMQSGCGLIQDVERLAGVALRQLARQFHPLGLAAGQGRGILTQLDVGQPHLGQDLQLTLQRGNGAEHLHGLGDR